MGTDFKKMAALAAAERLPAQGVIGLGTGSTAKHFIDRVAELVRAGRDYRGVPTSKQSAEQARSLGIPLLDDDGPWAIDVCVDGADEVSPELSLIKGGGGALLREKIVNHAAATNIIVCDATKLSPRLGEKWPIPIEVVTFGHASTARHLSALGEPTLRRRDGVTFRTDAGNVIYDLAHGPIADPAALDAKLRAIPGVVETGLFVRRASLVLVADADGVRELSPR